MSSFTAGPIYQLLCLLLAFLVVYGSQGFVDVVNLAIDSQGTISWEVHSNSGTATVDYYQLLVYAPEHSMDVNPIKTTEMYFDLMSLPLRDGRYYVQIRAVTESGPGNYSYPLLYNASGYTDSNGILTTAVAVTLILVVGLFLGSFCFLFTMCKMRRSTSFSQGDEEREYSTASNPARAMNSLSCGQKTEQGHKVSVDNSDRGTRHSNNPYLESSITALIPAVSAEHVYEDLDCSYNTTTHVSVQQTRIAQYAPQRTQMIRASSLREVRQPADHVMLTHSGHGNIHRQQSLPTVPELESHSLFTPGQEPRPDRLWYRTIHESQSESMCESHSDTHPCPGPYDEACGSHLSSTSDSNPEPPLTLHQITDSRTPWFRTSLSHSSLSVPMHTNSLSTVKQTALSDSSIPCVQVHHAPAGTVFENPLTVSISSESSSSETYSISSTECQDVNPPPNRSHRVRVPMPAAAEIFTTEEKSDKPQCFQIVPDEKELGESTA